MIEVTRAVPLATQITEALREHILSGDVAVGERLNEVEIASRYGVSRTPIREALRTLAQEGLVQLLSGGAFVANVALVEIRELLQIREALDVLAIGLAGDEARSEDLDELEQVLRDAPPTHQPGPRQGQSRNFHVRIFELSGNRKLAEYGRAVNAQLSLGLSRVRSESSPERAQTSRQEHLAIVAALKDHDIKRAQRLMRDHDARGVHHVLEAFEQGVETS